MQRGVLMLAGMLALAVPALAKDAAAGLATAVAAPGRPEAMVKLDEGRKPAAVLAFAGLKPGMKAADIMAGSGYYTEIMARAVGAKGHVDAYDPVQFAEGPKQVAAWNELKGRNANVSFATYPFESFAAPAGSYDFAMLHLVYHDIYWESAQYKVPRIEPASFLKTLYAAMKPGGVVAVIDHVAPPGDTRAVVDKTHRIDPAVVKADFKAAGFVLTGESDMLRNPGDDHGKLVFDPSVRGKTDRFVLRFVKPKK